MKKNMIAEYTEDGAFGDESVDCAKHAQQFRMIANRGFHVGRWNGDTNACAGTQGKGWGKEGFKFADGGVVDIDREIACFGRGVAGASAKGFAGVSVKQEPEHLPYAESSRETDQKWSSGR